MLILAGLGLGDERDISIRAIEEARKADKVYIELYTNFWLGNLSNLEKIINKKILELKRKDLEEDSKKILEEAKEKKVLIFVAGSPLVATTHISLILEARKMGIETKVLHNASILVAVSETGLHLNKFGQFVTIPFPEKTKGSLPFSVYESIEKNINNGLHTLCLLDIDENSFMDTKRALEILLKLENERKLGIITENSKVVIVSKVCSDDQRIAYGKIKDLIKKNFGLPASIIIPGNLHFTEEEFLSFFQVE